MTSVGDTEKIYHERQSQMLCGLHAINNLLQRKAFTRQQLDEFAYSLSPESSRVFNPHKSWLGLGNFDVNVLTIAIESTGLTLHWWDKRKSIEELDVLSPNIYGFLLNIPSPVQVGMCKLPGLKRSHWVALRWIPSPHHAFYNLDSKLSSPKRISSRPEKFRSYLLKHLVDGRAQLLLIKRVRNSASISNVITDGDISHSNTSVRDDISTDD